MFPTTHDALPEDGDTQADAGVMAPTVAWPVALLSGLLLLAGVALAS